MKIRTALYATSALLALQTEAVAQGAPVEPIPGPVQDDATQSGTAADSSPADAAASGDIVVTAQHRKENVQDVPISVSAFDAEAIRNMAISTPQDIFKQVPNVGFQSPGGVVSFPIYNIRGITQLDFNYTSEASVATYRDGVYMGTTGLGATPLYDLERIEVLRGPQGTLWGRNATGGLLHFISARPTQEFHGNGTLQFATFGDILATGAVSGPLAAGVRGRLAVRYNDLKGVQTNQINGRRHWSIEDAFAARGMLDIDLSEDTLATISAHYSKMDGQNDLRYFRGLRTPDNLNLCSIDRVFAGECINTAGFRRNDRNPRIGFSNEAALPAHHDGYGGFLQFQHNGDISLTSITGYEYIKRDDIGDVDGSPLSIPPLFIGFGLKHHQISQELRAAGETGPLRWQVGGIYYGDRRFYTNAQVSQNRGSWSDQTINSLAVFTQGTYAVTDTFNLTAGGRYTRDSKHLDLHLVTSPVLYQRVGTPIALFNSVLKDKQFTWRLGADWHPTPEVMIYASASTGYKLNGFNTNAALNLSGVGPVDSETSLAYELGVRTELFDRLLTFNLTGFYTEWNKIQAASSVSGPTGTIAQFANIGDAEIYGLEAELRVRPTRTFSFHGGAGYIHNVLKAPGIFIGTNPLDGKQLANTPKFSINGSASWEPELLGGNLLSGVDVSYRTSTFSRPDNLPHMKIAGYTLVDARIGWAAPENRYRIEAFAKNLFDVRYFTFAATLADAGLYHWGMPRQIGVRLSTNF